MKLGLITVSLNVMLKKEEADYILDDAKPAALIAHEAYLPLVQEAEAVRDGRMALIEVVDEGGMQGKGDQQERQTFQDLLCEPPEDLPGEDLGPDDEAVIAYTSGTTGFPKGAVHTHQNILLHLDGIRSHLDFSSEDVILAALPFFQLVAFLIHPGLAVHVGGTVVIMEKFEPGRFLALVGEEAVTFFGAVPTIYRMLFQASEQTDVDLGSVRFGICAGSPLSLELRGAFEKRFTFRIIHCYGMTEISLIAACEDPASSPKGISVGCVLPYIRLGVTDPDGLPADMGEVGEIRIGAERALARYWNMPEETEEALEGGWFATGDMGRLDAEGHLHIVDRKKDMIIRGGFNVFPAEIERVLLSDPRVLEVAVIGVSHERLGEVPRAFVVLRDGAQASEKEFKELVRARLAHFKSLEDVVFVAPDFFPRNALGKILKRELL